MKVNLERSESASIRQMGTGLGPKSTHKVEGGSRDCYRGRECDDAKGVVLETTFLSSAGSWEERGRRCDWGRSSRGTQGGGPSGVLRIRTLNILGGEGKREGLIDQQKKQKGRRRY